MPRKDNPLEDYLTIEQAQEELNVSRRTIYNMIGSALLTPIKAGWSTLFRRDEVERVKQERQAEKQ